MELQNIVKRTSSVNCEPQIVKMFAEHALIYQKKENYKFFLRMQRKTKLHQKY